MAVDRSRCARSALGGVVIWIGVIACGAPPSPPPSSSPTITASASAPPRATWLDDLDQLEHHLGRHYATLAWSQAAQPLDLVALDRDTRVALRW
jgi:hypothetical protein